MHADEIAIDAALVRTLIAAQFPAWSARSLDPVSEMGTDNALFRLGDDLVVRLPRIARAALTLSKECRWLGSLAPHLPVPIPVAMGVGVSSPRFPHPWAVYRWLDGERATPERIADEGAFAMALADFIAALQAISVDGGPAPGSHNFWRGGAIAGMEDGWLREKIVKLDPSLDLPGMLSVWDEGKRAAPWARPAVWIHGDLDRQNLLVAHGKLSAVIDFGGLGVGDPSCDVAVVWKAFSEQGRGIFRKRLGVDDATWARSRAFIILQSANILAYYTPETHPVLVSESRRWVAAAIAG